MTEEKLQTPTREFVKKMISNFNSKSDEPRVNRAEVNYPAIKNTDLALNALLKSFPNNKILSEIYLKVVAINALYSTSILDTYRMAYHIYKKNIDDRLSQNDLSLVSDIATGHGIKTKNDKEFEFYSFATKYCSFHKPDIFPIYDSYIHSLLNKYNKKKEFLLGFNQSDFRNYEKFLEIIKAFQYAYDLSEFSVKEIDKFLWIYSTERLYREEANKKELLNAKKM